MRTGRAALFVPVSINIRTARFLFIDIDECELMTAGCEQLCENRPGSFICTCIYGYQLQTDGKTCTQSK